MKKLLLFFLILFPIPVNAGNIFVVHYGQCDAKLYCTDNKQEADLIVYQTVNKFEAKGKDYIWFFNHNKFQSHLVRWVGNKISADLIIYFTNNKLEAGWNNSVGETRKQQIQKFQGIFK